MVIFFGSIASMIIGFMIFVFYPGFDWFRALSVPLMFGGYFVFMIGLANGLINSQLKRHIRGE